MHLRELPRIFLGFGARVGLQYVTQKAVTAAVTLPWSNGQVEGQIHRLKLVKRQMYGRASFNLLRRRVLPYVPDMLKLSPERSP